MKRTRGLVLALLLLASALACAGTRQLREAPPESGFLSDYSKLAPGGDDRAKLLYVKPGLSLATYRAVFLEPVQLRAAANDSDLAKLSPEDRKMLADRLQTALHDALAQDWTLAPAPGPNTLRIRAALTEAKGSIVVLDTVATVIPQVRLLATVTGLAADTSATVGKATGELEVLDGASGEQLMAAVDERVGTRGIEGVLDKWSDVQMAFDDWAQRLRQRLAELRGTAAPN